MVFQQPNPFPMSVFDNVAYVLREQGSRRPAPARAAGGARGARACRPARRGGDDLGHPALRLSGGQQQRLCIARALAAQPEVLLLDEPCSALDPLSTQTIEHLIVKLRDEVAVVIVTHNLQQAYRIADHVAFMYLGELVEYGARGRSSRRRASSGRRTTSVVRSASGILLLVVLGGALAGCATTHQQSARLGVRAQRLLASARPVFVAHAGSQVVVLATALLRGRGGAAAIVVPLRNTRSLSSVDLPLTVGLRGRSGRLVARGLNRPQAACRTSRPTRRCSRPAPARRGSSRSARGAFHAGVPLPQARVGGVATLPPGAASALRT